MKLNKRSILCAIFILCFILSSVSSLNALHMLTTKLNNEINPKLQKEISQIQSTLLKGIKNKNYEEISALISPKLSELENFDLKSFVDKLSPILKKSEFVVLDQYYSILKKIGKEKQATIIPSLSEKDKFIINNLTFHGKESYNLFLRSTNSGWQFLMFVSLSKFDDNWKINIIRVGNYSINNLTIPKLYELAKVAKSEKRLVSSSIYLMAMNQFLRPAPYLQYMDEQKYIDFGKQTFKEANAEMKFPITLSDIKIIGINITTTTNEGIIPVIMYVTNKSLKEPTLVKEEANQLKDEVVKKLYGLDQDFGFFIMKAHNEIPSDPKKTYNAYNTVIFLNE